MVVPQVKPTVVALSMSSMSFRVALRVAPVWVRVVALLVLTLVYGEGRDWRIGYLPETVDQMVEKSQELSSSGGLVWLPRK